MQAARSPHGVTALIAHLGELFVEWRLAEAARLWAFPCPVEVEGELLVMRDAAALEAFLRRRREAASRDGLVGMTPHVIAIEVPRDGRFRAWFRWVYHYPGRSREDSYPSVYYMIRRPSGELSIEMMDVVRTPAAATLA